MVQILQLVDNYKNKIFLGLIIKIAEEFYFFGMLTTTSSSSSLNLSNIVIVSTK
jgi:hypothetical protein